MTAFQIDNALVLTMAPNKTPRRTSVRVEDGRITHVADDPPPSPVRLDAEGCVLMPSFVQTHVHLCQTLFRNLADDLSLMDWLRLRIWPMEGAHTAATMRASADLGLLELIRGGTTTILDMGSVHHTDSIAEAVVAAQSRIFLGKAMMDRGQGVPRALTETTQDSLREAEALKARWHNQAGGRIQYAYAPRFAPSCSTELLRTVGEICEAEDLVIHTHCAESRDEIAIVREQHHMGNLEYLDDCGITGKRSVFAHMVHLEPGELDVVKRSRTAVAHCPSSNCKLASGFAPIPQYLEAGIKVGLGADGAPCNNRLDSFTEMRLAALIHKPTFGPLAMDAETVLRIATLGGAESLGLEDEIGTIAPGKSADLVLLRLDRPFNGVAGDVYGQIVYTASHQNVRDVWCAGERLVQDGRVLTLDEAEVMARATEAVGEIQAKL